MENATKARRPLRCKIDRFFTVVDSGPYFSFLLQERFGMDLHVSDLGHDLFPAGHRADARPPAAALLLPGLDVLGAPPGMTLHCQ